MSDEMAGRLDGPGVGLKPNDTLLTYADTTRPDPIEVSPSTATTAELIIVASNNTNTLIYVESIQFSIPVGKNAKDFARHADGISLSGPADWTLSIDGATVTAKPNDAAAGSVGSGGLSFVIANIAVNNQPGTSFATVTEKASGPDSGMYTAVQSRTWMLALAKFPVGFAVTEFVADPLLVASGGATTLQWKASLPASADPVLPEGSASYLLQYGATVITHPKGEPNQPLPAHGSYTISPIDSVTTFYLQAIAQVRGYSTPQTIVREMTVTLEPPTIKSFGPKQNPVQAESITLDWVLSQPVPIVQLSRHDSGAAAPVALPVDSSQTSYTDTPPTANTTYTLTIWRNDMTDSARVQVTMQPPVPVGTISSWFGSDLSLLPAGWLACDGSTYSQVTYPELEPVIKAPLVPDLRGQFLRGLGGADPDAASRKVGSHQGDGIKSHTHEVAMSPWFWAENSHDGDRYINWDRSKALTGNDRHIQNSAAQSGGLTETRPTNIAVNYIIFAGYPAATA